MDGIELMASAMHAAQARVDVSADNLANVSSDGFRKHVADLTLGDRGIAVATHEDASGGVLRPTGRAFDLAVAGKGALFVREPDGRVVTERSASFERTASGTYVDDHGRELLGQRGPLHASAEATIDARGIVRVNDRAVDRLRATAGAEIRSGFLQASNVDAVRQMVEVLSAQRAFETSQKNAVGDRRCAHEGNERRRAGEVVNRALYAAASGMAAQQKTLDLVSDNLANADVAGFKSATATFAAVGGDALLGTANTGTHQIFTQGKLMKTGGAFDVAIDGTGFFRVAREGQHAFTRAGSFTRGADGLLRNEQGWHLEGVRIPKDAVALDVGVDGRVGATLASGKHAFCGRIALATFDAPERLHGIDSAIFGATAESGEPHDLPAGRDREPKIQFGMLEKSNVSIIESMMAILSAQRAYEANSKGVQAADEMLRIANNLHRS